MGKLAEIKTKQNVASVKDFIAKVPDAQKQKDSLLLLKLMEKMSKEKAMMWGGTIIGFGKLVYKSPATGREVEWFKVGFSPRKANLTVYVINVKIHAVALKKLGKHKTGGGCLYINKLEDIDMKVLEGIIKDTLNCKQFFG